jgi:hypothetical protein
MTIEDLARAASADLRSHTTTDLDAGLDAVLATHSRRRRQSRVTIALAAAAAVAAAWWGGASFSGHPTAPEPAPAPSPTSPSGVTVCADKLVTCLGDRTYRFALDRPVTWQIPHGFGVNSGVGATSLEVESYARSGSSGVTVMESVRAASPASLAASGVPATADAFVHWLADRPYLRASAARRTTFDGRPAWRVRVAVKRHQGSGPGRCGGVPTAGEPCHPIVYQDGAIAGLWSDMTADYTALDVPGSGTMVVWSWAFGHDTAALARNRSLVAGISVSR